MDINSILANALNTIIVALVGLASAYIVQYINVAIKKIKTETKSIQDMETRILIDSTLDNLSKLVKVNVESAQETIVKELKQTTVDGKLDIDDAKTVLNIVKGKVLAQLSDSGKEALGVIIDDLEGYVEGKIEVSLKELKANSETVKKA